MCYGKLYLQAHKASELHSNAKVSCGYAYQQYSKACVCKSLWQDIAVEKNNWVDESGRVYVMYTIASMAAEIGKSETTIKNTYKELEKVGLLQRVTTIKGKPNRLYVMLPEDNIGQIMDGGKLSVDEAENSPWVGKKTTCDTGRKLSFNYINSKNNNISNFI